MRRFFKKIHLWLAIPSGLLIFILCITGSILSFQEEILEIYYPEKYFVESNKSEKLPLSKLIPIVDKQLENNSVASIKISSDTNRTYVATLENGFRETAFIDPYTGQVKGTNVFTEGFFFKIMTLHRWLMDGSRTWGKYTMGITTIFFVVILISGVVWWVPTKRKHMKNRLVIKTKYGFKRFFYDCHIVLGIYSFLFLLLCSLTGLMWSFDWYRTGVSNLFGAEKQEERKTKESKPEKIERNIYHWDDAFNNLEKKVGKYKYITIGNGNATVLTSKALHSRAADKYTFDLNTGNILNESLYKDQKIAKNIMTWAYALHVGSYGGIVMRILTCLACIIGATLPLTGYYIWWRKKKKKNKR